MTTQTQTKRPGSTLISTGVLVALICGVLLAGVAYSGGTPSTVLVAPFATGVALVAAGLWKLNRSQ